MFVKNGVITIRFLASEDGQLTVDTETNGLSFLETLGVLHLVTQRAIRDAEDEAQKAQKGQEDIHG